LGNLELKNKNPGREFLKAPDLTQQEIVSGPKGCRQFLLDGLKVITLFGIDKPSPKDLDKHNFFVSQLTEAAQKAPQLAGPARLLSNPENCEAINRELEEAGAKPIDNATFMVDGDFLVDDSCWHGWWRKWMAEKYPDPKPDPMLDILTGQVCTPEPTHYKIGGLSSVGGLSSGDSLVSFNKEAFTSFGLAQSANAAFSRESAKKYAESLNYLIRTQGKPIAGAMLTYWFKEPLQDPENENLMVSFFQGDQEKTALNQANELIEAIESGSKPKLISNRFYALTLSGASGRVMVRDWMEGPFEQLARAVYAWFSDLEIVAREGDRSAPSPSLWGLLGATVRDLDELKAWHVASLYRAALSCGEMPRWAQAKALSRLRSTILTGDTIRHTSLQLLKACLKRNTPSKGGAELNTYLNEEHPEPAYHCGRLMAVYASLQRSALGDVGAGVVQRFYAACSATPALILGRLAKLSQFHLSKLEPGLAYWFEDELASIAKSIDSEPPTTLDLTEQTLFALGYYQQMAKLRPPKKAKTRENNENAPSADEKENN
jgi:CRISPR-associated protein Csd1